MGSFLLDEKNEPNTKDIVNYYILVTSTIQNCCIDKKKDALTIV